MGWGAVCAALLSTPRIAGGELLSEQYFLDELPQVLSASRLEQPLSDTPVAITVIDRATIEASGALDVPHLLRLVPGFQVTDLDGTESIATYHGFSGEFPRRMQVMVDGRSIYDPGLNGVLWASLPVSLDQIERIEVVRGANAAAYGSNAVLGSINIVTRHSTDEPGLKLILLGGSRATLQGSAQYAARHGDWSYRAAAVGQRSDGYERRRDDSDAKLFNLRADYHPVGPDSLTLQVGFRRTDFESELFQIARDRLYRSHYQHLIWNRRLASDSDLRLQLYHNYFEADDAMPPLYDLGLRTHRYDAELQHVWSASPTLRVSWGGGLRLDTAEGGGIFTDDEAFERRQWRLFGNAEWRADPAWLVNGGLMLEDFDDNGAFLSPRLALNWRPFNGHTLRLAGTRGFRMPTILEQHAEVKFGPFTQTITDPGGIEPERIESFELGYFVEMPAWRGHMDVRLYRDTLTDVIMDIINLPVRATDPRSPTLTFMNVGTLKVRGIEFQADLRPFDDTRVQLAYAYANAPKQYVGTVFTPTLNQYRSSDRAVANHTATLMVTQELPRDWTLSGLFHYVSGVQWLSEGDPLDSFRRVDARASKRMRLPGVDLRLSLIAHNLLNEPYWEFQEPDPPFYGNRNERSWYAELVIQAR
jgi:iron complex outermembrane receptor protein